MKTMIMRSLLPLLFLSSIATAANDSNDRIVGGSNVAFGRYPFYAFVLVGTDDGSVPCGGSLIHKDVILTAASCIAAIETIEVAVNLTSFDVPAGSVTRLVTDVMVHPAYNADKLENDIALLQLEEEIPQIAPAVLSEEFGFPMEGDDVVVIGFGSISDAEFNPSRVLQKVDLQVADFEDCNAAYDGILNEDKQMCGGVKEGGKDSCFGDSGGPMMTATDVVVGIVSGGNGCGKPDFPGFYTRVSSYIDFIERGICDLSNSKPSSCPPVANPTAAPAPVANPVANPTDAPVANPVANPTDAPVANPVVNPTDAPVVNPVVNPTDAPVANPVANPTDAPVVNPVANPTNAPAPVSKPVFEPTRLAPVAAPIVAPTPTAPAPIAPVFAPTAPTKSPTKGIIYYTPVPTRRPTESPEAAPQPTRGGNGGKKGGKKSQEMRGKKGGKKSQEITGGKKGGKKSQETGGQKGEKNSEDGAKEKKHKQNKDKKGRVIGGDGDDDDDISSDSGEEYTRGEPKTSHGDDDDDDEGDRRLQIRRAIRGR